MSGTTLDHVAELLALLAALLTALGAWIHSYQTAKHVLEHTSSGHPDALTTDLAALMAARREGLYSLAAAYWTALEALRAVGDDRHAAELEAIGSTVGTILAELELGAGPQSGAVAAAAPVLPPAAGALVSPPAAELPPAPVDVVPPAPIVTP